MNSRARIITALSHKQPDLLPIDIGGTNLTGIHVSNVYRLRQHYGLDNPGTPVKVIEPYQMLGEIADDLKMRLGTDNASPEPGATAFGYAYTEFKRWDLSDGTPVLVPRLFNTETNSDGSIYQYPGGDRDAPPSGKMPQDGYFFDAIIRQKNFEDSELDPKHNVEEYGLLTDEQVEHIYRKVKYLNQYTSYAVTTGLPGTSFGDIYTIPGISLPYPKGIRDIEEWYVSLVQRKEYVKKMFSYQLELGLENLEKLINKLGDLVQVVIISGADFGTQTGLFAPLSIYREMFKPYHKKINDYIHSHSNWKTFIHSCGAVYDLIPELIESGFDILNPVQISAAGMKPKKLKTEFGRDIVFWGGGVDTQKTLPFGAPREVKDQVKRLIETFAPDGGFVFAAVHNVQANVPLENIVAMIEALGEYR